MLITVVPINRIAIDLSPFNELIGKDKVNKIDSTSKQPINKFVDAVDEVLPDGEHAYRHIFQTFYVDVPLYLVGLIDSFPQAQLMVKDYEVGSMTAQGLITASHATWKDFLSWASSENDKWLTTFIGPIVSYFKFSTQLVKP